MPPVRRHNQNQLIAGETLFTGTINRTEVHPREVIKRALYHNAAAVVLAHNHPSGEVTPSKADRLITERLVQALGLVDIRDFLVEKYALVRTDQPGFSAGAPSQLINSIDILRARRATGLMTRNNYRMVNNITQGKHPEAKQ